MLTQTDALVIYQKAAAEPNLFAEQIRLKLHGAEIGRAILVRGFLTDACPPHLLMHDWRLTLQSFGLSVRALDAADGFSSQNCPEANARALALVLQESPEPTLLLTHSKGSLDALTALVREPSLRQRVKGWISVQGALGGSPLADWVARLDSISFRKKRGPLLKWLFSHIIGGDAESLRCLREGPRREFMEAHAQEITELTHEIPVVAFGSVPRPGGSWLVRLLGWKFSQPHDSHLALNATCLHGATCVHLENGPDHLEPVIDLSGWPFRQKHFDRQGMLTSLLAVLAEML